MNRVFILREGRNAEALVAFIKQNAGPMARAGTPMECICREHKPRATDAQRGLLWLVLNQIAAQAWVGGRQYDAETWGDYYKRKFLPEVAHNGKEKYRYLPDDTRELAMSSEDLNRQEKSAYVDQIMADAATELGIQIEIKETKH